MEKFIIEVQPQSRQHLFKGEYLYINTLIGCVYIPRTDISYDSVRSVRIGPVGWRLDLEGRDPAWTHGCPCGTIPSPRRT